MTPDRPEPHDWVLLRSGWRHAVAGPLAPAELAALESWDPARRPLVAARSRPEDARGALRLGLALPGRVRVGVVVQADVVLERRRPLPLEVVLPQAMPEWRAPLARLAGDLRGRGTPARVFGSLAWQHVAADPALEYVTPASDVDLLLAPTSWRGLQEALATLSGWRGPPRLDGEALLPGGLAVSWRELASGGERVLAKGPAGAAIVAVSGLRRALAHGTD